MELNEMMRIVDAGYPDGMVRLCWDEKNQQVRGGQGDTLAEFIVREIVDTFDATADTRGQIQAALDAMRWAAIELGAVISALEGQLCEDATDLAERKGDRHGR